MAPGPIPVLLVPLLLLVPAAGLSPSTAALVGELAVDSLARLLMLQPFDGVSPWRAGALLKNATLQPIFAAVDRCELSPRWID